MNQGHYGVQMDADDYEEWLTKRELSAVDATVQLRTKANGGGLHMQVFLPDTVINRPYGFASVFSVPSELTERLASMTPEYMSFASPERVYVRPHDVALYRYKDDDVTQLAIVFDVDDVTSMNTATSNAYVLNVDMSKAINGGLFDALSAADMYKEVSGDSWKPGVSE